MYIYTHIHKYIYISLIYIYMSVPCNASPARIFSAAWWIYFPHWKHITSVSPVGHWSQCSGGGGDSGRVS